MKKITEDEFTSLIGEKAVEFADKANNPELWHQMAMDWNWDNKSPFLNWLIDNPATDQATALMIYWKFGPKYWTKYRDANEAQADGSFSDFEAIQKIEERYLSGFYPNNNFYFNPSEEDHQGTNWSEQYNDISGVRELPEEMLKGLDGKVVEPGEEFEEGMPPKLLSQIEKLYNKYEIIED